MTSEQLVALLEGLRVHHVKREEDLYVVVSGLLAEHGFRFRREVRLGGVMGRIDYVVEVDVFGGFPEDVPAMAWVGIEVKHGPVQADEVLSQIQRYLCSPLIDELVLITERGIPGVPSKLMAKPVHQVALHALWGIAL